MGYLAVHISPRSVLKELDALYDVTNECERFAGTTVRSLPLLFT
uniref:DUF5753 domain-containing protein n=1 Tax=Echinococcus granulosus TaxID=6210 RepID=U6FVI1_ECHGR|nr:hypothetical protein EgrG_000366800 [Echinococcus granulosus]